LARVLLHIAHLEFARTSIQETLQCDATYSQP
jgi:hypothetical protein